MFWSITISVCRIYSVWLSSDFHFSSFLFSSRWTDPFICVEMMHRLATLAFKNTALPEKFSYMQFKLLCRLRQFWNLWILFLLTKPLVLYEYARCSSRQHYSCAEKVNETMSSRKKNKVRDWNTILPFMLFIIIHILKWQTQWETYKRKKFFSFQFKTFGEKKTETQLQSN